ncbi:ATP cone domain-containing protein [Sphingobacterium sp. HJSM2_6]|uniref:ATP cone domain-containing protein n=1 Tax=Sphingobacterium sp. HJSM2_6 TaxID=3366264 RepID=UPI003BC57300
MLVKKYSGELVPFDETALRRSLLRSGASEETVNQVYTAIQNRLYDGISTKELYELAFDSLKSKRSSYAARYSLKRALRELGPEGFYFEKWVARLFQEDGYNSMTGQTIQGHAVTHEIDVIAQKNEELLAVECKFRNDADAKISVTTPMYFKSRVTDIMDLTFRFFNKELKFTDGWLVTNAYFTSDSVKFGTHYHMNLLSWDYPAGNSLKNKVDNNGEYPITCLTTISDQDKAMLLKNQCILVKDLLRDDALCERIQITKEKKVAVIQEAKELINSPLEHE